VSTRLPTGVDNVERRRNCVAVENWKEPREVCEARPGLVRASAERSTGPAAGKAASRAISLVAQGKLAGRGRGLYPGSCP
jgi:hypothetical protein